MSKPAKLRNLNLIFLIIVLGISHMQKGYCANDASYVESKKKVIVLGFDGMDPKILMRLVKKGDMPNFRYLMKIGDYKELQTSMPPQSPVAWSNFITGMDSGGHGIYDFIHRDPETMVPYLSTTKTEPPKRTLNIGNWVIPLSSGKVTLLRKGESFWEILVNNGVPSLISRIPANYPPTDSSAYQLSGMGTPDIQGTYGTFSFYTDEQDDKYGNISGGKVYPVKVVNNKVESKLYGPKNSFKKNSPQSSIEMSVIVDPENPLARITLQDQQILLSEGEWSGWVKVEFKIIPFFVNVRGICRFYLKEVRPHFKLYVTPINIDPSSPYLPISRPKSYSVDLSNEIGLFFTQGIPEDTKALSENILNYEEFLQQSNIVYEEELRMFDYELNRFKEGFLFFYFGRVDQLSHMFWGTMDSHYPAYADNKYEQVIDDTYRQFDEVLGKAISKIDENTTLIVLSDHGFAPFYRKFNLNTWLKKEGYISLTDDAEGELFRNVDWTKSSLYGLGFNGLYVNLKGREKKGIVNEGKEKEDLINKVSLKLLTLRDPKTGDRVVLRVHKADEIYRGPYVKDAPDLIIGYNIGYRASWETVLGKFPMDLFEDNTDEWSGDHLMEADLVPGILLTNKKINLSSPALYDIAPTILDEFGIKKVEGMIGKSIFKR